MISESSVRLDETSVARALTVARASSVIVMLVGGLAFAGWLLDVELLKGFRGAITMKANAALALLLAGASLWLLCGRGEHRGVRSSGQLFALVVGGIGAATLSQHLFGWELGIDQLLFTESPGALATASPGRMGPPASICFTLAGISLSLLHGRRLAAPAQWAALGIGLMALLAITGYAYSVETLYGVARYTGIALHTALALLVLSLGLLAASVDRGFASVLVGVGAGSLMARRLLGFALLAPLLLGWVRLQLENAGYYGARFGLAVLILSIIVILATLVVRTALRLNRIELKQLAAEGKLRDRLHEIETMMEVLPIGVFIATDRSADQITGNRAARELLRMPHPDANLSLSAPAGESPVQFRVFHEGVPVAPEDLPVQRAARDGVAIQDLTLDLVFADGVVRNVSLSALPLLDAQGGTRGAVASVMDITARRAAEKEREDLLVREQEARAQAEEANRAKDDFLAMISHELRTPLNAILGWASMLRDGVVLDAGTTTHALETIERSCKAQAQLIEDLLDVSRIRAGMLRLDMKPVDLVGVITAAADVVRPTAEARQIELRMLLGGAACPVRGDAARLQQVVWNLLTNAVKFSARGATVEVRLVTAQTDAALTVADSGEGISPEFLPHVFDRFRQAESGKTRRRGGLGLGLSIAQHLVEMHGGRIEAVSEGRGRGASFTVHLPLLLAVSQSQSTGENPPMEEAAPLPMG